MSLSERSNSVATEAINRAAVIGGGSFGTALALALARKGCDVSVWARTEEQCKTVSAANATPIPLRPLFTSWCYMFWCYAPACLVSGVLTVRPVFSCLG